MLDSLCPQTGLFDFQDACVQMDAETTAHSIAGFYALNSCGTENNPGPWGMVNGQSNLANHASSFIDFVDFHLWPGKRIIDTIKRLL